LGFDDEEGEVDLGSIAAQQATEATPGELMETRMALLGILKELRMLRYLREIEVLVSDDKKKQYEDKKRVLSGPKP
jgi:hypothetical protein